MKIKLDELKEKQGMLDKLASLLPMEHDSVLFFPIEIEDKKIEDESGVSMFVTSNSLKTGIASLISYGVMIDGRYETTVSAAYYEEHGAITLDITKFLQVVSKVYPEEIIDEIKDLDCKILKKSSILFDIE